MRKEKTRDMLSEAECLDMIANTPPALMYRYIEKFADEVYVAGISFRNFMYSYKKRRNNCVIGGKKLYWNEIFSRAGLSNTYGYKLVGGHKTTLKRDTILRLCLACEMTPKDAEEALWCSGMPSLRARNPRDAVLISAFGSGIFDPEEVSRLLVANGQKALEECGNS